MSGYNWRNSLGDYATTSGVLAGFTLAFIVFILGSSVGDSRLVSGFTWGEIGVLLNGVASALFVASTEFFLSSKSYDVWNIPEQYEKFLEIGFQKEGRRWDTLKLENLTNCRKYEGRGRWCYNVGIFVMFTAFFFVIGPYNLAVAVLVTLCGVSLELLQIAVAHQRL